MKHNTQLGQHFMIDKNILDTIISVSHIREHEPILEIGPGDGALTRLLQEKSDHVRTIEIDTRFDAHIHGNVLELIEALTFESVISNLPYYISEPLFAKFTFIQPKKIVVVVGDTFARKLQEETIIGCVFRDVYDVVYIQVIPPEAFNPPPKVLSALISCSLKASQGPLADFYSYSKTKVKNYLKTKTTKRGAQEFINKLSLPLVEKKLYELNTEEFLELQKIIVSMV